MQRKTPSPNCSQDVVQAWAGIKNITSEALLLIILESVALVLSSSIERGEDLCHLPIGLVPTAAKAGRRPREVGDRNDEEAVAGVGDTSQGVVPSCESSQETEHTTCLRDLGVGRVAISLQVGNTEQQEGDVQEEEEQEEGDGRLQCAEEQDGGEDEPSLFMRRSISLHLQIENIRGKYIGSTYHEEKTHRVVKAHGSSTT